MRSLDEVFFVSSDMGEVSAYFALGYKPKDVFCGDNDNIVYFAFEDFPTMNGLSYDYFNRRMCLPAVDLMNCLHQVRSKIFETQRRKKDEEIQRQSKERH